MKNDIFETCSCIECRSNHIELKLGNAEIVIDNIFLYLKNAVSAIPMGLKCETR
jgi:hypothetical protein